MKNGCWKKNFGPKIRHLTKSTLWRTEADGSRVTLLTVDMYRVHGQGQPDTLVQVWLFHDWVDDPEACGSTYVFTYPMRKIKSAIQAAKAAKAVREERKTKDKE